VSFQIFIEELFRNADMVFRAKSAILRRASLSWEARKSRAKDAHDISNGVINGPRKNRSNGVLDCV
jgi:hypothetical protein